jgi:hypothetical protein
MESSERIESSCDFIIQFIAIYSDRLEQIVINYIEYSPCHARTCKILPKAAI